MMDAFLKDLDWRARAGMCASLALVGFLLLWIALRSAVAGPWFIAAGGAAAAAIAMHLSDRTYPGKLPDWISDRIAKWQSTRSRSTQSKRGRFVWNLGRSMFGMMAVWQFLGLVPHMASSVRWIVTAGAGFSCGFFGMEAAIWSGIAVGLVAHATTAFWLKVDFSDPQSRGSFQASWEVGATHLSWMWLIAMILAAPLWIGVAATVDRVKEKIREERAQRSVAAADRKRIDARRRRQRERAEKSGGDPLVEARKRLAEAEAKVGSINAGKATGTTQGVTELKGAEKLENDRMVEMLRRYGDQVRAIRDSERDGFEPDANMMAMQRGFDRVLIALTDPYVEYMKSDSSASGALLLGYYEDLCAVENRAMRSGDGEVVTSSVQYEQIDEGYGASIDEGYGPSIDDEEDRIDDVEEEVDRFSDRPPVGEFDEEDDGMGGDVLDGGSNVSSRLAGFAAALEPIDVEDAPRTDPRPDDEEGEDGDQDMLLPVDDDVSETESRAHHGEPVVPGEIDDDSEADRREEDGEAPVVAEDMDLAEPVTFGRDDTFFSDGGSGVAEGGSDEDADVRGDEDGFEDDDARGDDHVDDHADDHADDTVEDVDPRQEDADAHGDREDSDDGGIADVDRAADDVMNVGGVAGGPAGEEYAAPAVDGEDVMEEAGPDAGAMKNAAAQILMKATTREMVVRTAGWFRDVDHAASVFGIDAAIFGDPFAEYDRKVSAFGIERALEEALVSEPTVDRVQAALDAVEASDWEHDPDLAVRARAWIAEEDERVRAVAAAEAERLAAAAAALAAAQAAREEEERAAKAADEFRDRVERERIAQAVENARMASEAEANRAAEAERTAELERKRGRTGLMILVGKVDDETLSAGAELFSSVEELAASLDLEIDTVRDAYETFSHRRDARQKFEELAEALRSEDVSVVEALLSDRSSFEGYQHPKIDLDEAKKWADGVRAKERMQGLIDVDTNAMRVPDTGGASRRLFMMKRTRITKDLADIVDEKLPKGLRLVKSMSDAIEFMGDDVPEAMRISLATAEAQVGRLAAQIVAANDEKGGAREYAMAFLPIEVRKPDVEVWEMLVGIAATVTETVTAAPAKESSVQAPVPAAEIALEPVPSPEPVREDPAAPAAPPRPPRIRPQTPVSFRLHKTLDEVQAMDFQAVVNAIPQQKIDQGATANRVRLSLREIYGRTLDENVRVEGDNIFASVIGDDGDSFGQIRIWIPVLNCPVWYVESKSGVVLKNPESGHVSNIKATTIEREMTQNIGIPNGDPETIIGAALLSYLITSEGVISFEPMFKDRFDGRATILQVSDAEGLRGFFERVKTM